MPAAEPRLKTPAIRIAFVRLAGNLVDREVEYSIKDFGKCRKYPRARDPDFFKRGSEARQFELGRAAAVHENIERQRLTCRTGVKRYSCRAPSESGAPKVIRSDARNLLHDVFHASDY